MPNFKKLLHGAKQFEALQTHRKAKDVAELEKFQFEQESHRHLVLRQNLDFDQIYTTAQAAALQLHIDEGQQQFERTLKALPEAEVFEREGLALKMNALLEAETFAQAAFEVAVQAEHFQDAAETAEPVKASPPAQMKQLLPASPDPFAQELSDLTETCLQQELENNDAALKQAQADTPKNLKRQTLYVR